MPDRPSTPSEARGATALVWFDADLRLADNPALPRAIDEGFSIVPVFVWSPGEESPWQPGSASRWWLHQSLESLQSALGKLGAKLIVRRGPVAEALAKLAAETEARFVFWNRRFEPSLIRRDQAVESLLRDRGISTVSCPGNLLFEPGTILNGAGKPFQVFTAFWRACQAATPPPEPRVIPKKLQVPGKWPSSLAISDLKLEPAVDWAGGLRESWQPGESGASAQLARFTKEAIGDYSAGRDRPDREGTSRLSPHLHFGEISARRIWHGLNRSSHTVDRKQADAYLRQIAWREFSYHLLYHYPQTPQEPLRPEFRYFPWRVDETALKAWTRGKTGYPLVDAGMRELWHTGWMHNRVRMLVASFLVKHLMIPWQEGAAWFWDTLVDADLANNTMGWQWSAGCGADAAPYFRIFNPVLQGEKFDPDGAYVRRWVPELTALPDEWIQKPWKAPGLVLAAAGVQLGKTYPLPIVDHDHARARALEALARMKNA